MPIDIQNNNGKISHPTIFVIFGITGDLAARKLLPALIGLYAKKLLPDRFCVIGFSRRSFSREEFRELIRGRLNIRPGQFKEEDIKHFFDKVSYEQGHFDSPAAYGRLSKQVEAIDKQWGQCSNKLFHLSVPPSLYEGILNNLATSKLTVPCGDGTGWTRILIEKPFGNDIETAASLDKLLGKLFKEEQIFRIDHYLAKEVLQNILAFRFHNSLFEPVWNRKFVSRVHIKLFEKIGVEGRGALYDKIGALTDVGQNHMLQMLSLIAMERPKSFDAVGVRRARAKTMRMVETIKPKQLGRLAARGQYEGYLNEPGVLPGSKTETYFRIEAKVNNTRWKGVPFYLESGKGFADSRTEIDIYFNGNNVHGWLRKDESHGEFAKVSRQNILTFRIQPEECIKVRFFVKAPGKSWITEPRTLKFKYSDVPEYSDLPNDYERLIGDAFSGDQMLFASTEEIMASWRFITPIAENWSKVPLKIYKRGVREIE
ncbi:glucose-6-phosphate dehydrogenase [Patescibacteria group bacterium]|nr:glucose-6-phosphate dehydrogenase [Patescibacteria group bacterium]MDE1946594.1 glucose-6-phosphate dehydrogenase [Patescibacteria group bacterium]MDE2010843.1 glucose-6-phosphate dehydrogenase [Patescibacteria group bacterium]MDE2233221.1 glucose-6-phosphate dehydrogenase [Patescibacteria group bacterium]